MPPTIRVDGFTFENMSLSTGDSVNYHLGSLNGSAKVTGCYTVGDMIRIDLANGLTIWGSRRVGFGTQVSLGSVVRDCGCGIYVTRHSSGRVSLKSSLAVNYDPAQMADSLVTACEFVAAGLSPGTRDAFVLALTRRI